MSVIISVLYLDALILYFAGDAISKEIPRGTERTSCFFEHAPCRPKSQVEDEANVKQDDQQENEQHDCGSGQMLRSKIIDC